MTFDALNRQLKTARRMRNVLTCFTLLMVVSNLLLAGTLTMATRTTVLIPTRISDGMVANGNVDIRYVEAVALDAVYSFFNTSPETTDYGRKALQRIASIRTRPALLEAYDAVAKDIQSRRITTVFFVTEIEHDWEALEVTVTGDLTTYIETNFVDVTERKVVLSFTPEASSVRLADFEVLEGRG